MGRTAAFGLLVLVVTACGGEAAPDPDVAKACLQEAGFDTGGSTGILGLYAGGEGGLEQIVILDDFTAVRGTDEFAVWFFGSGSDASSAAEVIRQQLESEGAEVPQGEPRVSGPVVLATGSEASDPAVTEVEGCLGF